jgi:hypothetical protein
MAEVEDFLEHYGTKGMKWGVRKSRSVSTGPSPVQLDARPGQRVTAKGGGGHSAHPDAIAAVTAGQKAKRSSTDTLSTQELQQLVTRMNLEQQYSKLAAQQRPRARGAALVKELMVRQIRPQAKNFTSGVATDATNMARQQAMKKVAAAIAKKAVVAAV